MRRVGVLPSGNSRDLVELLKESDFKVFLFAPRVPIHSGVSSYFRRVQAALRGGLEVEWINAWIHDNQLECVISLDNNLTVSRLAKNSEIPIVVIQHGMRHMARRFARVRKCPNLSFLCWGDLQKVESQSNRVPRWPNSLYKVRPGQISVVGSLRDDLALAQSQISKSISVSQNFDICLVSQFKGHRPVELHYWQQRQKAIQLVAQWVGRFTRENSCRLVVAGFGDTQGQIIEEERWLRENLNCEFTFFSPRTETSSLYATESSKVTVGVHSSVLWEAFGRHNKVLAVNPTTVQAFNFPVGGLCSLQTKRFDVFEQRMTELLAMTIKTYEARNSQRAEYLVLFRESESVRARVISSITALLDG